MSEPWDEQAWAEHDTDGGAAVEVLTAGTVIAVDTSAPLTMDEARELTESIRGVADVLYVLLGRAHAGRAWEALGYASFEAYVREEFDLSRSRAYQLLNQAKVIEAIEAAVPAGTDLHITEAAARDLKSVLGDVLPEIEQRTAGLPANEAAEVVDEIVEDYRSAQREKREARDRDAEEAAAARAERNAVLAEAGLLGSGGDYPAPVAPDYSAEDEIDAAAIRRNVQAAYDLYSTLSALKSMPDVQTVVDTIPEARRTQINETLRTSTGWLAAFTETWFAQPWQSPGSDDQGSDHQDYDGPNDQAEVDGYTAEYDAEYDADADAAVDESYPN